MDMLVINMIMIMCGLIVESVTRTVPDRGVTCNEVKDSFPSHVDVTYKKEISCIRCSCVELQ